jgi:hypothetical protein
MPIAADMNRLVFDLEWLGRVLDLPEETATFAALRLTIGNRILTRSLDTRLSTVRERVHVPTFALALGIAQNWWRLLYEVDRESPGHRASFEAFHALEGFLPGYAFPPVGVWSGGIGAVAVGLFSADRPDVSPLEFLERPGDPFFIAREDAEADLAALIDATLARTGLTGDSRSELAQAWDSVRASLDDPSERAYCESAGRLGLDPYDPDAPDLTAWADQFSEPLFADICEAATIEQMEPTVEFVTRQLPHLREAATIDVTGFPSPPRLDLSQPAAWAGYEAARRLRSSLKLGDNPKIAVSRLLGKGAEGAGLQRPGRLPIEGVLSRSDGTMRSVVVGQRKDQRRFRMCRATFLAWMAEDGADLAITTSNTRAQQASRAFGAELMAPESFIRGRAGNDGLTPDDVEELGRELSCSTWIIQHQIENHQIGMRGGAFS